MKELRQVDVAVVGAGPAGLAASVRVRWVKSHRGVPCSVVVFDPAPPGGLARMRSTRLTGPGFHLSNKNILSRFLCDIETYNIPIEKVAIDRVEAAGKGWVLFSGDDALCKARAVILSPGLRRLSNEADFFDRGLSLTSHGYDLFCEQLKVLVQGREPGCLVIVGNAKTRNLQKALETIRRPGLKIQFLIDETENPDLIRSFGKETLFGRVLRFLGGKTLTGVQFIDADGRNRRIACRKVYVDYAAFEIKPEKSVAAPGLKMDRQGFIRVNRRGETNLPGLFAAGDVTGLFAMAIKAMSEGTVAGFSAYSYVFRAKFGYDPPLFAYAGSDRPIDPEELDYPQPRPDDMVQSLYPPESLEVAVARVLPGDVKGFRLDCLYAELEDRYGIQGARDLLFALMDIKACTLQPRGGEGGTKRGPALRS